MNGILLAQTAQEWVRIFDKSRQQWIEINHDRGHQELSRQKPSALNGYSKRLQA